MLSVCIPVYNFKVTDFIRSLKRQCDRVNQSVEILIYDDASSPEWLEANNDLLSLKDIRYHRLQKNIGRSRIRNKMAKDATGQYLLFLDGDSAIENNNFIQTYIKNCRDNILLYGGCSYQKDQPEDPALFLRWHYGRQREAIPFETRKKHPDRFFTGNNFSLSRKIFLQHPMNTEIKGYGYEDSLLLSSLKRSGIRIKQLDNPLRHTGLEPASVFLKKTDEAVANLAMLIQSNQAPDNIRLIKYWRYVDAMGLSEQLHLSFQKRKKQIIDNLLGPNPQLRTLDFYKLAALAGHLMKSD